VGLVLTNLIMEEIPFEVYHVTRDWRRIGLRDFERK
jgi:hypothetical protein